MVRAKKTYKRKAISKSRLVGYTKAGSKFALVYQKGRKKFVGKQRYSSLNAMMRGVKKNRR